MSGLFGGGKTKTTTVIQVPPPTAAETEAQGIGLALSRAQLAEFKRAQAEREAFGASPEAAAQRRLETLATENLIARLEGRSPVLSPQAEQRVGTAFGAAKTRGLEDLTRLANETAALRGLTRADSPIAAPFLQESGRFVQGLEGTRAGAELDVGQTEALFNQSLQQFQAQLQQQAFMNRLALAGGQFAPGAGMLQQNLFAQRMMAAPRSSIATAPGNFSQGLAGIGSLAGGLGGLAYGLKGLGGLFGGSGAANPYGGFPG